MTDHLRSDFHYHFQSILELLWKKKSEEQEHFVKDVSQKLLVLVVGSFNCIGILASICISKVITKSFSNKNIWRWNLMKKLK